MTFSNFLAIFEMDKFVVTQAGSVFEGFATSVAGKGPLIGVAPHMKL